MLRARPELRNLVPIPPLPAKDQLPVLREQLTRNPLFRHLLLRLQQRYLELALRKPSNDEESKSSGYIVVGARNILECIDRVLDEAGPQNKPSADVEDQQ